MTMANIYTYGRSSTRELNTVSPTLKEVFILSLGTGLIDITILEGRREEAKQNLFYDQGKSKVQWPYSKHNVSGGIILAEAVDAAPYVNGKASDNWRHCIFLAGVICTVGSIFSIPIRWGGNWDMDGEPVTDQGFQDLWHYERIIL